VKVALVSEHASPLTAAGGVAGRRLPRASRGFCRIKPLCYCGRPGTNDVLIMTTPNAAVSKMLKRLHYPLDVMLTCLRCYVGR
jgi:hypothetical protein